jgi:hypothetical protein
MQVFQLQEERKLSARDKSLDPWVRFFSKIRLISIIAASLEKTEYPADTILSDFAQATPPNGDLKAFSRQWQAIFQLPQWLRDLVDETRSASATNASLYRTARATSGRCTTRDHEGLRLSH